MSSTAKYDLEERTAKFGEDTIDFIKTLPSSIITRQLTLQLIRSATSVGANYCEADSAETRKDFTHKLGLCKKEAKETRHWLRMLARLLPDKKDEIRKLWVEADELQRIFISIVRKTKENEQFGDSPRH